MLDKPKSNRNETGGYRFYKRRTFVDKSSIIGRLTKRLTASLFLKDKGGTHGSV